MSRRKLTIELTIAEVSAVLYALGNSIYDGTDRDVFTQQKDRNAVWRGHNKLKEALRVARGGKASDGDEEVR